MTKKQKTVKTPDFRQTVLAELDRLEQSRYWLVQQLSGQIPASTIYQWLAGRHDLPSEKVFLIFKILGLTISSSQR